MTAEFEPRHQARFRLPGRRPELTNHPLFAVALGVRCFQFGLPVSDGFGQADALVDLT
nr:hypothetical protein [Methylosarcina fibrata]